MKDNTAHSMPKRSGANRSKTVDPTDPLRDSSRGIRLQKALAAAGISSRRHCEELIEQGAVRVNGKTVTTLPAWVDPAEDEIFVNGLRIPQAERKIYIMLNKPRRVVTTCDDPGGRRTVADYVVHPADSRLFPIGRLDYETSGLLLLTNDGELTNRLTHPRFGVEKTYRALVRGRVDEAELERLGKGLFLVDRKGGETVGASRTAPVIVRIVHRARDKTMLDLVLKEGRNRQVRRMLVQVGHPVIRLERTHMGPLKLKGLARGEWRELSRQELGSLRKAVKRRAGSASEKRTR